MSIRTLTRATVPTPAVVRAATTAVGSYVDTDGVRRAPASAGSYTGSVTRTASIVGSYTGTASAVGSYVRTQR